MFEKLKSIFTGLNYAWKYGDILRSVTTAWNNFPGWNDSELLRLWIRPIILDASVLTTLTKTTVDDLIALAAIRIVDNNNSWNAVHALALLIRDGIGVEGSLIPQSLSGNDLTVESIAQEACPECPAIGLAAIGLLLTILQNRQRQRSTLHRS